MKRLASLVTALGATVLAIAAAVTAPAAGADTLPASTPAPLRYVSYNICGNACADSQGYDNQKRIDTVVAQASAGTWNVDEIFLQEVCRPQYNAVLAGLAPLGFSGSYAPTLTGRADVCSGADYGVAVLVKGSISDSRVLDLTVGAETEPIKVPCVRAYVQNRANWACSVHLYWSDPALGQQEAQELAAQAKSWRDAGTPVVLGGDFNAGPRTATTSQFYDTAGNDGGTGIFTEADQSDKGYYDASVCVSTAPACRSGQPTFNTHKIDYLFLSSGDFSQVQEDVVPQDTTVSDHRMVRGAAYWADCGPTTGNAVYRRDASGALYRYTGRPGGTVTGACKVGTGWNGMRLVTRDGRDLMAVDTAGTLWRYPVTPADGSYSGATRIAEGNGWQTYDQLLAPGDFTGDGRADLIGRDGTGILWLYAGNGVGGYSPRTQIGNGWQTYSALAAPGDLDGDGRADLVGRDTNGTLWFYAGNGAGYYSPRTQIGFSYPDAELLF